MANEVVNRMLLVLEYEETVESIRGKRPFVVAVEILLLLHGEKPVSNGTLNSSSKHLLNSSFKHLL